MKLSSYVNEIAIQYTFDRKYPKPKNQPYKNVFLLLVNFFFLKIKINNKLKVTKLMKNKLYGGKLNEVRAPKTIKNINSK